MDQHYYLTIVRRAFDNLSDAHADFRGHMIRINNNIHLRDERANELLQDALTQYSTDMRRALSYVEDKRLVEEQFPEAFTGIRSLGDRAQSELSLLGRIGGEDTDTFVRYQRDLLDIRMHEELAMAARVLLHEHESSSILTFLQFTQPRENFLINLSERNRQYIDALRGRIAEYRAGLLPQGERRFTMVLDRSDSPPLRPRSTQNLPFLRQDAGNLQIQLPPRRQDAERTATVAERVSVYEDALENIRTYQAQYQTPPTPDPLKNRLVARLENICTTDVDPISLATFQSLQYDELRTIIMLLNDEVISFNEEDTRTGQCFVVKELYKWITQQQPINPLSRRRLTVSQLLHVRRMYKTYLAAKGNRRTPEEELEFQNL